MLGFVLVATVALIQVSQLEFSHNELEWFSKDSPLRHSFEKVDDSLRGSANLEVVIDTETPEGLINPEIIQKLSDTHALLNDYQFGDIPVGNVHSILLPLQEIHQHLFSDLPFSQDSSLLAQEFLMLESNGYQELSRWVSSDLSQSRISLNLPWLDVSDYVSFLSQLEQDLGIVFEDSAKVVVTGMVALGSRVVDSIIKAMSASYFVASISITLVMIAVMRSSLLGLFSMVPNFLPIVLGLGLMRLFEVSLDLSTILVGSIALGLVVDDTIHFMKSFQHYRQKHDLSLAIDKTLQTTGRAMVITTLTLSLAFLSVTTSSLQNFTYFGVTITAIMFFALLCDLLLLPAMVTLVSRQMSFSRSRMPLKAAMIFFILMALPASSKA